MSRIPKDLALAGRPITESSVIELPVGQKVSSNVTMIHPERLARIKAAYTTRRVTLQRVSRLLIGDIVPRAGDLVLARVEQLGQHQHIELASGRLANLFAGDEIIVCYGNQYAPEQFEAVVPGDLRPCHLVAGGGIAARVLSKHDKMRLPTMIRPLGLLGDGLGRRFNLADWGLQKAFNWAPRPNRPFTVAVVGSSVNAGETTTAANLIRGMTIGGMRVGAAKVTGTAAAGSAWLMRDAGAEIVIDFTDTGLASTYLAPMEQIQESMAAILDHLCAAQVDAIVLQVADGLYQAETAALLASGYFKSAVDAVICTACDAIGGTAGIEWLKRHGLPVLALSGVVTQSELAVREVQRATGVSVLDLEMLRDPIIATHLGQQVPPQMLSAVPVRQAS